MNRQEFNNICDKWRVLCAIMMSKGYFPTVARELFFTAKKINEEGYSDELCSEFNKHFKAISYGISKEYKHIMKNDDLSQAFIKEFLLLSNRTTLLLEGRQEIPDNFIDKIEIKMSDKARDIYIEHFA